MITSANDSDEPPDAARLSTTCEVYPDVDTAGRNVNYDGPPAEGQLPGRDAPEQRPPWPGQRNAEALNGSSDFAEGTTSAAGLVRLQGRLMHSCRSSPSAATIRQSSAAFVGAGRLDLNRPDPNRGVRNGGNRSREGYWGWTVRPFLAAHLVPGRPPYRIFGQPMRPWQDCMPPGMFLPSGGASSSLSHPDGEFPIGELHGETGRPFRLQAPIPVDTFVACACKLSRGAGSSASLLRHWSMRCGPRLRRPRCRGISKPASLVCMRSAQPPP